MTDNPTREETPLVLRDNAIFVTPWALGRLLGHASSEARLSGLSMLVLSKESTRPFSDTNFDALRVSLPHLHADTDADFRGEVLSLSQALIYRVRSIASSASRVTPQTATIASLETRLSTGPAKHAKDVLRSHTRFLRWYVDFLGSQLHPSASYQRHITAIKALHILLQSGLDDRVQHEDLARLARKDISWPFHLPVLSISHVRALTDLLLDAFDDVRQAALGVLKLVPLTVQQQSWALITSRADAAMRQSGRVDYADGVARCIALEAHRSVAVSQPIDSGHGNTTKDREYTPSPIQIMTRILTEAEESVGVAEMRLALAVEKWPVHGHMTALR